MAFATDLYFRTLYNFTASIFTSPSIGLYHSLYSTLSSNFSFLESAGSTERSTLDELQLLWLEQVLGAHTEGPPGLEEQEFSSDVIVFKVRTVFLHKRQTV